MNRVQRASAEEGFWDGLQSAYNPDNKTVAYRESRLWAIELKQAGLTEEQCLEKWKESKYGTTVKNSFRAFKG
jgi:hypothetical protein